MTDNAVRPVLVVDFGDEVGTFSAYERANQALLVQYADDVFGDGFAALKAVIALATDMVVEDERDDFGEFLLRNGRFDGFAQRLYDGLDKCWKGETTLPLEPSSDSSETSSAPD